MLPVSGAIVVQAAFRVLLPFQGHLQCYQADFDFSDDPKWNRRVPNSQRLELSRLLFNNS
jgi:hypothetical protein